VTKVRIVRPKVNNPEKRLPVVVFFSWTWRRRNTVSDQERFIREFAAGAQVAVVCVDQDHPADHLLPLAVDDAYAATKWVAAHGESLNLDTSKLGVAAEDSGCEVIAGVRSLAETRRFPAILFQILF
jgi:acetyl esterase